MLYQLSYVGTIYDANFFKNPTTKTTKKPWSGKRDSNPRPSAWKADALAPELLPLITNIQKLWWRGEGSNLRRLRRQIYSLLPLAAREPLQFYITKLELAMGLEPATC